MFGCVSGGDFGAMGMHYVNFALVGDGEVDAAQPEIVLFEPTRDGGIRITGADYLVLASDWDAKHQGPPELMGQLFHLFDAPNRFGLPPFYTLHVWAWKDNPAGTFTNWNPNGSCDAFNGQTQPERLRIRRTMPSARASPGRQIRDEAAAAHSTAAFVLLDRTCRDRGHRVHRPILARAADRPRPVC